MHKEICAIWENTAATTGEGVRDIKKKMNEFMWLVRGLPDYSDELFKRYISMLREGRHGCVEFIFHDPGEIDEANRVLRNLPIIGKETFRNCPNVPQFQEKPNGVPITLRRRTAKHQQEFMDAIDTKMCFIPRDSETRPNLLNMIRIVGSSERMIVLCATTKLGDTSATSSYEFLFKGLSWSPEDSPTPARLAIEGASVIRRNNSFDMD